ncbi:MAG: GNAT family N-acetyltransferase [Xanthomonadales bacterium]|nr:GNAT family N-acetyltransferase [Xanthomonadales bacterium]
MNFSVDQAGIRDLDTVAALFDAYRQFYEQPSDPDGSRRFLRERFQLQESLLLLARDPQGAGLGFTQLYPLFSSVRAVRAWLLNDLFVAPQARRHGVGAALLREAATRGRELGAGCLMLSTALDNAPAQALYASLGWHREASCEYLLTL